MRFDRLLAAQLEEVSAAYTGVGIEQIGSAVRGEIRLQAALPFVLVGHRHKCVEPLRVCVRSHNRAEIVNGKGAYGLLARKNDGKNRGKFFSFTGGFAGFRIKSDVRSVLAATNYIAVAVDACGLGKRALRR